MKKFIYSLMFLAFSNLAIAQDFTGSKHSSSYRTSKLNSEAANTGSQTYTDSRFTGNYGYIGSIRGGKVGQVHLYDYSVSLQKNSGSSIGDGLDNSYANSALSYGSGADGVIKVHDSIANTFAYLGGGGNTNTNSVAAGSCVAGNTAFCRPPPEYEWVDLIFTTWVPWVFNVPPGNIMYYRPTSTPGAPNPVCKSHGTLWVGGYPPMQNVGVYSCPPGVNP